jgi:ubiquinone/menaquinone biosynthesis C-methylase UbiE
MIALDGPLSLGNNDIRIRLIGWCNSDRRPENVRIIIDGVEIRPELISGADVDEVYPHLHAVRIDWPIDFAAVYANPAAKPNQKLFAPTITIATDTEDRTFEYTVTPQWVQTVFAGRELLPIAKPATPAHLMVRVSGSSDPFFYPSGRLALAQIKNLVEKSGVNFAELKSILDFGGGCGRVALAWQSLGLDVDLHVTDIDKETIAWCAQNLAAAATWDWNEGTPPTRYRDAQFDLVYGISVFTHLPEGLQFEWLKELRRIIKPGGLLVTTIHGPTTYKQLPVELHPLVEKAGFVYVDQTKKEWPSYLGAKTEGLPDFYRLTYHTHAYVRREWSRYFDILTIEDRGLNFAQDGVVCRRRQE